MNSYKTRISPSAEPQQFQIFVELWHFTFQLCERHKGSDPGQGIPSLLSWAPEPEATLFSLKYLCYVGSFLILRTENLNIWREKMELNWLAHKEVHSPMEAFGAEEFIFLFKWTTCCPFFRVRSLSCKSHCQKQFKTQPCTVIQQMNWWYFPPRKRRNG